MHYVSTRGQAAARGFVAAAMTGLAEDGGLFVPTHWPALTEADLIGFGEAGFARIAAQVLARFSGGDLSLESWLPITRAAAERFAHPAVVPLVQLDDGLWLMELFHGPTLAFKDVALQILGGLFDHVLAAEDRQLTVLGATSGDTGSAAMAACAGRRRIDCVILFPHGRPSPVQRRQMTTLGDPHVQALAIEGSFDDCQDIVKALFADPDLRRQRQLTAVNSINWARVAAQISYYAIACARLRATAERPLRFAVPTGNFGNVLAGHAARAMGLPIGPLSIGSNRNDILTRLFTTGTMALAPVEATLSPSMDIQVSSNLERYLFELHDRDGAWTRAAMAAFRRDGRLTLAPERLEEAQRQFRARACDDAETQAVMQRIHALTGIIVDPHTAVGLHAAMAEPAGPGPVVALACAHPAKFPDAVEAATGLRPKLPEALADLFDRPEVQTVLPADAAAVKRFLMERTRAPAPSSSSSQPLPELQA